MIPQRPLLLITLPSIALVLGGLVYFRRKKKSTVKEKNCDSGGDTNKPVQHVQHTADKAEETQAVHAQPLHSQSRPISQQSSGNNKWVLFFNEFFVCVYWLLNEICIIIRCPMEVDISSFFLPWSSFAKFPINFS